MTSYTSKLETVPTAEKRHAGRADYFLIIVVAIIAMTGVVMVFSASYYYSINMTGSPYEYLKKQAFFSATGFALMMLFSRKDYHFVKKWAKPLAVLEIILLLAVFTPLGETRNGATRWINVGITIMPGELAKPAVLILLSTYFSENMKRAKKFKTLLPAVIYVLVCCLLIIMQPNLSTAITVALIGIGIAFIAGMHPGYLAGIAGIGVLGLIYLAKFSDEYMHDRVVSFLNPFEQAQGNGYQVVQSLLALGTGGVTGLGLGKSIQKNLYLPEPHNDFILAIIGEELGFIGVAAIMVLFALLVFRLVYIAVRAEDNFGMLFSSGFAMMVGFQVALNVAVVTSSMPPTGIALPFISYGGNSTWIFMVLMGIALNVSRHPRDVYRRDELKEKIEKYELENEKGDSGAKERRVS